MLKGWCKECGRQLEFVPEAAGTSIRCPYCTRKTILPAAAETPSPPPIPTPVPATTTPPPRLPDLSQPVFAANAPPKGSFEMRVGTFWLVRIGIVMLLTGLRFLGNYTDQNF